MPNYSGIWTEQAVMQAVGAGNWPGNPGAPTIGTATAGDASASVTFTAPTDNGGSAITGYTVTSSPGGLTGTGASSPITVSGLTNGTAYTFTVTATNATGTGPASAASNSVTPAEPVYIENVYSTYLYTNNTYPSNLTITNGIDLSGKGGLVWMKNRNLVRSHNLYDTARGAYKQLRSDSTGAQITNASGYGLTAFNADGFSLGTDIDGENYGNVVSWTFREQPKFFDVVTYTGTGSTSLTVNHNLGSTPGCIIIKWTSGTGYGWYVYHRATSGTPQASCLVLNSTGAAFDLNGGSSWIVPSSTNFQVATTDGGANASGESYVAYLFAHNAGGFGLNGTDNVISCGSFTQGSGNTTVTLGYEPQWVMIKSTDATGSGWEITDNMRAMPVVGSSSAVLYANLSNAESSSIYGVHATATGFVSNGYTSGNFIYIAIRRGPMKVPTSGTSVYNGITRTGTTGAVTVTGVGFTPDMGVGFGRSEGIGTAWYDRLRGKELALRSALTNAEYSAAPGGEGTMTTTMDGMIVERIYGILNSTSVPYINWFFKRAPSFFDEVCYTGTGTTQNITHNLGVVPELWIVKKRSSGTNRPWRVGTGNGTTYMALNSVDAAYPFSDPWNDTAPTASVFTVGIENATNESSATFVAYLFATCAGVSKVGSYTGTGALQTINCGFATGARFVLIKRTDSAGDWWTYDSARGITSSNDPYLFLNSTAAEVTGTNYVDTTSVGFQVTAAAPAGINASGGTYIFLAIA